MTDGVKTVSDNVIECRNQILAEKESKFIKASEGKPRNRDGEARLASKQASENLSAAKGNNEQKQVANAISASQNHIKKSSSVTCVLHCIKMWV